MGNYVVDVLIAGTLSLPIKKVRVKVSWFQ